MTFTKIFNISNKKFIIFENQSYEVTEYFSNNQPNFSIYIPQINQHFWIVLKMQAIENQTRVFPVILRTHPATNTSRSKNPRLQT